MGPGETWEIVNTGVTWGQVSPWTRGECAAILVWVPQNEPSPKAGSRSSFGKPGAEARRERGDLGLPGGDPGMLRAARAQSSGH